MVVLVVPEILTATANYIRDNIYIFFLMFATARLKMFRPIMTLSLGSFLSLSVFWKAWCVSGKKQIESEIDITKLLLYFFFFFNIESDLHICLTNPLNKNPFYGNQPTCNWGQSAGMFHESFTSAWQDWEAGRKPEASFCLVRYLPLLILFCSSSPKCLTCVNRQYRQQVQSIHLPTCRSHLAALGEGFCSAQFLPAL